MLENLILILGKVIALGGFWFIQIIAYFAIRELIDEGMEPLQTIVDDRFQLAWWSLVIATIIFATMWNYIFFKKFTPWISKTEWQELHEQWKIKYK